MVLVFLCLGGWLPSHHRRDTCNHGAAPLETRWTWLRAADTQAVRESWSSAERVVCHAPHRPACQLERHETPDPVRSGSEFPVPWRPAAGRSWVRQPPDLGRAAL